MAEIEYRIVDMRETTKTAREFAVWDIELAEFLPVNTAHFWDGEEAFRDACHHDQECIADGFESAVCALLPQWARS